MFAARTYALARIHLHKHMKHTNTNERAHIEPLLTSAKKMQAHTGRAI